jgi:hypothetical protein
MNPLLFLAQPALLRGPETSPHSRVGATRRASTHKKRQLTMNNFWNSPKKKLRQWIQKCSSVLCLLQPFIYNSKPTLSFELNSLLSVHLSPVKSTLTAVLEQHILLCLQWSLVSWNNLKPWNSMLGSCHRYSDYDFKAIFWQLWADNKKTPIVASVVYGWHMAILEMKKGLHQIEHRFDLMKNQIWR